MNGDLLLEKINYESIFLAYFFLSSTLYIFFLTQFFIESICGKQFFIVLRKLYVQYFSLQTCFLLFIIYLLTHIHTHTHINTILQTS